MSVLRRLSNEVCNRSTSAYNACLLENPLKGILDTWGLFLFYQYQTSQELSWNVYTLSQKMSFVLINRLRSVYRTYAHTGHIYIPNNIHLLIVLVKPWLRLLNVPYKPVRVSPCMIAKLLLECCFDTCVCCVKTQPGTNWSSSATINTTYIRVSLTSHPCTLERHAGTYSKQLGKGRTLLCGKSFVGQVGLCIGLV